MTHSRTPRLHTLAAGLAACLPLLASAAGVSPLFDLSKPQSAPFPSDRYTVADNGQRTFKRVNLPQPDCAALPSDCADVAVLNTLDGFSAQPRITVPFSGDINPASVTSQTVFLVSLGDTLSGYGAGQKVGINQVVWDVATKTLSFESDELLNPNSRYVLVVTNGIKDAQGDPVESKAFAAFRKALSAAQARDGALSNYRKALLDALNSAQVSAQRVVALSLFTTQSTTTDLEKIRVRIKQAKPAPADFNVAMSAAGPVRAVFPVSDITAIQFNRQTGAAPAFTASYLPTPALNVVAGSVAQVAYGKYSSPNYLLPNVTIPATPTLTGEPKVQGRSTISFQLFVPAGAKPAGGWPVAIFGHGFTDSQYGAPWTVASVFASRGIATLSINAVGHGGGAQGTLNVIRASSAPVAIAAGGRGIDQDGNGNIDATEGLSAVGAHSLISNRDGLRQTVVDLMQLVRQVEVGMDVDGDGSADLDANRIYYAGQSLGGIYGTALLAVEPNIKAGVPNVPGGSLTEISRLGAFRQLAGGYLATRKPSLINVPDATGISFFENTPLRNLPPVTNTVPGATAIQQLFDRNEWAQMAGNPVAYAAGIRKRPLAGNTAKPVIVQMAQGDVVVPNPTTTAIVRAGGLADRTTRFRNDIAYALDATVGKTGHTFLTNISVPSAAPYAVGAQQQIAVFFATNGATTIDPDGANPLFEVPLVGALPEGLNFIP
jgi:hypothetical protein